MSLEDSRAWTGGKRPHTLQAHTRVRWRKVNSPPPLHHCSTLLSQLLLATLARQNQELTSLLCSYWKNNGGSKGAQHMLRELWKTGSFRLTQVNQHLRKLHRWPKCIKSFYVLKCATKGAEVKVLVLDGVWSVPCSTVTSLLCCHVFLTSKTKNGQFFKGLLTHAWCCA